MAEPGVAGYIDEQKHALVDGRDRPDEAGGLLLEHLRRFLERRLVELEDLAGAVDQEAGEPRTALDDDHAAMNRPAQSAGTRTPPQVDHRDQPAPGLHRPAPRRTTAYPGRGSRGRTNSGVEEPGGGDRVVRAAHPERDVQLAQVAPARVWM